MIPWQSFNFRRDCDPADGWYPQPTIQSWAQTAHFHDGQVEGHTWSLNPSQIGCAVQIAIHSSDPLTGVVATYVPTGARCFQGAVYVRQHPIPGT